VDTVRAAVADGPRTRGELRDALDAAGVPTAGQALVHLLVATTLRSPLVRGPVRDGEHCFVDAEQWLGPTPVPDRDACLEMLARRYLTGYGPAGHADLAAYAGITLTDARRGLDLIADRTRPVEDALWALADVDDAAEPPPPRLLGMFDPVLHGWADRTFVTGAHRDVVTTNGMFKATALVGGRVAGTWTMPDGVVTLRAFRRLTRPELTALQGEAADVLRYLGLLPAPLRVTGP
jgi:hypothetical protein